MPSPPYSPDESRTKRTSVGTKGIPLNVKAIILISTLALCASAAEKPAQPAADTCVILKRMGPADQVTSHLYAFGLRGKQFSFVEGRMPEGVKFHGRLTDHDVRVIQEKGGRVTILDAHYTPEELRDARTACK